VARGDLVMFEEFVNYLGNKLYNFETGGDEFKLGLVDSTATPPAHSTATPMWADFVGNEVSGTGYTANGHILASQTYNEVAGVATFDAADVTWSQASGGVSGFTGAYWAVLYDNTPTSPADPAICYVDMGGPVNNNDGDVTVAWNASGIFTVTV
jgi:hypothetical protein